MSFFLAQDHNKAAKLDSTECIAKEMFEFKSDHMDFFLMRTFSWEEVVSMLYFVRIGNALFQIPSGLYIVLCDDYGTVDCMIFDEVIGRDVELLVLDRELSSPDNERVTIIDAKMKKHFWPNSNNIIPILSECKRKVILLSRTDQWKHTKNMSAYDFVG